VRRDNQLRHIVGGFVDECRNGVGRHVVSWVRFDEGEQVFGSLRRVVQPFCVIARVQNDRHTVVQCRHQFVWLGGNDGACLDAGTIGAFPRVPQTCENEWLAVFHVNVIWRFWSFARASFPFVKTVCEDDAAFVFE